jgi:protein-tyrosine phosphatase
MNVSEQIAELNQLQNVRDVGGLRLEGGGLTAFEYLYRSDAPYPGDTPPSDLRWPPRFIIDLRSDDERRRPHPLVGSGTEIAAVNLSAQASLAMTVRRFSESGGDLTALYIDTLDHREREIVEAVSLVAQSSGPVLVHCTAGKDRTGIVVAVILAAVGVLSDEIVLDYLRTGEVMTGVFARMALDPDGLLSTGEINALVAERPHLAGVSEEAIRAVLEVLEAAGGSSGWLIGRGMSKRHLNSLCSRMTDTP